MQITLTLNGVKVTEDVAADMLLIDFVRAHGCKSVKRGCETSNCGLCTVFLDEKPVLSCSVLAARASGHHLHELEKQIVFSCCHILYLYLFKGTYFLVILNTGFSP